MKKMLLTSASELIQPSKKAAINFELNREKLVSECNQIFLNRSDIDRLVGSNNSEMAKDNNTNFARFMSSIFVDYQPEVFIETVLWVFRAYQAHGFKSTYWPANINIWITQLDKELDNSFFDQIYPFYSWLIVNIPIFVKLTEQSNQTDLNESVPGHS